jgi:HNH endonuclease/NUMOD4 motif
MEWRPVPGYEGIYQVADDSQILSAPRATTRGGLMKLYPDRHGYPWVTLTRNGVQKRYPVHQLVAAAFIGPCPPGQEVRHKDGNPANPSAGNLHYGTHAENMQDKALHGTDHNTAKTHCPAGHEYTPENTRVYQGRRWCRACAREAGLRSYYKRRAQGQPSVRPAKSPEELARRRQLAAARQRRYQARKRKSLDH